MSIIVPPAGPSPNEVLLVGESPGVEESRALQPFVGRSGKEQDAYLSRYNLSTRYWRRTNVVQQFTPGNPDPTPEQIDEWTPVLMAEVAATSPKLIVAVGRFAARWFLGDDATMELTHGMPHRAGALDSSRADRAPEGCIILPVTHPAAGFYDGDARALIDWDYSRVAAVLSDIRKRKTVDVREDEWAGCEDYGEVTGTGLAFALSVDVPQTIALDTEGSESDVWSVQVSTRAGSGWCLRREQEDFEIGISALQQLADSGATFVLHYALFDLPVCRAVGLELRHANLIDSMYGAYLLRLEPQGLKQLAWRWCGMKMKSYAEVVGAAGLNKQIEYLENVIALDLPRADTRIVVGNNGEPKTYRPQAVGRTAAGILRDLYSGKQNKDGETTDPYARWYAIDRAVRQPVEELIGRMEAGSLADVDLPDAIYYAARDPDATLRLWSRLQPALESRGLTNLMHSGMDVLPVFEEMQATGMPVSRLRLEALRDELTEDMSRLQARISTRYFGGKPFNPKSPKGVAALIRRRGLEPAEVTKTGAMSTGKSSIEHLRHEDEAIEDVLTWRETQHTRDMFCVSSLNEMTADEDIQIARCRLKVTRTATRRLATADPNYLAFPKHAKRTATGEVDYGKRVRDCYICGDGEVWLECDFSQIESRMLAHESADPLLCRFFKDGRDIHTETAMRLFDVEADQVSKTQRFFAKRVNFGIPYGVSPHGFVTQLRMMGISDWDERDCQQFIDRYLQTYVGVADYIKRVEAEVSETGIVRDCWGMMRYLPAVWGDDPKMAAEARRQAVNHRIQGGAQGLLQRSLAWLKQPIRDMQESGLNVRWSLTIHDSLLLRVDEEIVDAVKEIVIDGMVNHCGMVLRVPVAADAKVSKTWGGL